MIDLRTTYLGLSLRSPLVASASPLTGQLDSLLALERAGAAAVVLPSLFEEEIEYDSMLLHERLETGALSFPEATDFFPTIEFDNVGPQEHVKLVAVAKDHLRVPVIASINGTTPGGWTYHSGLMADAGADAIELNLYAVAADPRRSAAEVESGYLEVVRQVRAAIDVPLAVKLSPYLSSTAHFARRVVEAGADGLVLFNRFYQPDIDLETLDVLPRVELSDSRELRLPLRWLAILRPQLPTTSLAATTGVHSGLDAAKALLVGADVVMMTSALLRNGPAHLARVESELVGWLTERDYVSVAQARGSVSHRNATDPAGFERANYLRTLGSYRRSASPA
ncbi:MAG TPA: dihydroorotate dehydrogenase-like protein [Pilimelia sp.]|nr:dihydroorotate dehydrogenase-like protein [Pilimelia sp.]